MINAVSSASAAVGKTAQINNVSSTTVQKATSVASDATRTQSTLSIFSRQLAESAVRADARDKSMDRHQLGIESIRIRTGLVEYGWRSDETGYVTEYPDTTDPELKEFRVLTLFEVMAKYKHAFGKGTQSDTQGVSPLMTADTPMSAQPQPAIKTNN